MTESLILLIRLLERYDHQAMPWTEFLPVFEQWCVAQRWAVEYHLPEDGSCAIFSCQDGWREEESQSSWLASPLAK